jgi:hypothetical protein
MTNQPNEITKDLPAFIENPLNVEIQLEVGVSVATPVTVVVGIDNTIQEMLIPVLYVNDRINFSVTPAQLKTLPIATRKKVTIYVKFADTFKFTIPITPTMDGSAPQPRSVSIFAPSEGVVRASVYDEAGLLKQTEQAASLSQVYAKQAQDAAASAGTNWLEKGYYNASTNTPALTANATVGGQAGKLQRYKITTEGAAAFIGNNFNVGVVLKVGGELRQNLNGSWDYSPPAAGTISPVQLLTRQNVGYTPGKNLFDRYSENNKVGFFVDATTGSFLTNAGFTASEFIAVSPGQTLHFSHKHTIGYYDSGLVFVSGVQTSDTNKVQVVPANAAYMSATVSNANKPLFQIELGSVETTYEQFGLVLSKHGSAPVIAEKAKLADSATTAVALDPASVLTGKQMQFAVGKNLFNPDEAVAGQYVDSANGGLLVAAGFNASGFMPVTADTDYYTSYKHTMAWYNAGKVFISGVQTSDTSKVQRSPAGAAFVRTTINNASLPVYQFEKGTVGTAYEKYSYVLDKVDGKEVYVKRVAGVEPVVETVSVTIAPKIYLPKFAEIAIQYANLYRYYPEQGAGRCDIPITGMWDAFYEYKVTGRSTKYKKSTSNGTIRTINGTIISYSKEFEEANRKNFVIQEVNDAAQTPKNVMIFGDSNTLRAGFVSRLMSGASATGITFLGIRQSLVAVPQVKTEGRGGRTVSYYLNDVDNDFHFNPFIQPGGVYKYYGGTGYWKKAHAGVDYDQGTVVPAVKAMYSASTGLLINPNVNDVMHYNGYKAWNGSAWVEVSLGAFSFNFAKYRSLYGIPAPDIFHMLLGTNDFGGVTPGGFAATYATFKVGYDQILASVKADNPNVKIIIGVPFTSGKQGPDGIYFTERKKATYWMLANQLFADYGNREAEGYVIADYHSTLDREYGYDITDEKPYDAYTGTKRNNWFPDSIHPGVDGFNQIGAIFMGAVQFLR